MSSCSVSTSLYFDIEQYQWPLVYHHKYNVKVFGGLEKLHVFDTKKWGHIIKMLLEDRIIKENQIVRPKEALREDLLVVHTRKYLNSLNWSVNVAAVTELPCVALLPNFVLQRRYLKPMRLQTGGSVLAGKLALERGWAINVGGGFHHCSGDKGGGFCPYADITLLIRCLMNTGLINQAMIVDLDAHQGNGYALDFMDVPEVFVMDMYNKYIYPKDRKAKAGINRKVELGIYVEDLEYMLKLRANLRKSFDEFEPDIVVYNAGTDVLDGDPLGLMRISRKGIIMRDEFVFTCCRERGIPIVMLTSGGYVKRTARIIADSITNLVNKGLIERCVIDVQTSTNDRPVSKLC